MIIFTADDFGSSHEVNAAVIQAHQAGTLHAASLMMGEAGTTEAVEMAKVNPDLRVGLHLVLVDGKSTLQHNNIPALVDPNCNFTSNPASAWISYLFKPRILAQLETEIKEQFKLFHKTGLKLSHVDGHHHIHIHPRVWKLVVELAGVYGAEWVRLPWENLEIWKATAENRALWKKAHVGIYHLLTSGKKGTLQQKGFMTFDSIFGIAETFSLTKNYVLNVLRLAPAGNYEFYFHPGKSWNHDLEILLDQEIITESKKFKLPDPWKIRA